jgi:parallel beta-helix repeat protein
MGTFVGISLLQSNNVTITGNDVSNSSIGIWLEASNFNTVAHNTMDEISQISIFVRGSRNMVVDNSLGGSLGGINIDGTPGSADWNVVSNNTIVRTGGYGIGLWRATGNKITGNTITDGRSDGIFLTDSSSNNIIESNRVTQNAGDGILISVGCSSNLVQRNTFTGNGDGISSFDLHSEDPDNIWAGNTFGTKNPETLG